MFSLLSFFAFALGAIVGSFLNVVIHRYPREESIVFPGSHCPHCNAPIHWYDNIPILSYVVLLARCRNCKAPISPRYPLVELANALFYLAIFLNTGATIGFVLLAAIISMTIALIYIDAEIQILPDVIDLPGIALGIAVGALALGAWYGNLTLSSSILDAVLGALFGASVLIAIIGIYWLVRRVEGMGQGDVKMIAMIGATLGWRAIPGVLLLASITGAIVGLPLAIRSDRGMQLPIPFGVFLGFAALVVLFFGP
ncbi:MAG TPA: prepilin peptidase, partial [Thermoanaerobaculia bacterium]|nr:prepilin peptidase [Thermoanaerobaculia bacterium]